MKPWLVLGVIFAAGMVTGAALTFGLRSDWMHPPGPQQMRSHWLGRLTERLNLTADQQAKIQPILADAGNQIQALHREEVDRISHIIEATNARIAPLLNAQQQAALKQLENERQRNFSGHLRGWGEPHDHRHEGDSPPPPGPGGPPPP